MPNVADFALDFAAIGAGSLLMVATFPGIPALVLVGAIIATAGAVWLTQDLHDWLTNV